MKLSTMTKRSDDENFSCLIENKIKRGGKSKHCASVQCRVASVRCRPVGAVGAGVPQILVHQLTLSRPGDRLYPSHKFCPDFQTFLRPCAALVPSLLAVDSSWWCTTSLGTMTRTRKTHQILGDLNARMSSPRSLVTLFKSVKNIQRASADELRAAIDVGRKQYWPKQLK